MPELPKKQGLMASIKKYLPYFVDIWQYLLIILLFILAAIFVL
jgi:hypothetical protein